MLRRIKPEQVRLGMFIEAVDGNWDGKKFWRSRFLLDSPRDLEILRASSVDGVIINTIKKGYPAPLASKKNVTELPEGQVAQALRTIKQSKPLINSIFAEARLGKSIPADTALQVVEDIATCMQENSRALIAVTRLKSKDEYTFLHSIAVTALMVHFGRALKIDECAIRTLAMGGLLHDVGKMKIPLEILNKTGRLTDDEMTLIRRHPQYSRDIVALHGDMPETVLDICLHHHERPDGKGYPEGLSGTDITIPVRIAAICDVFDALTSLRAYKKAWPAREAAEFMLRQKGQFDRPLLTKFCSVMNLQPT
ncbi:HD-GYP domain-containing protein (plasmid) [Agrobacterium tumefaciens]|uniref:HD-GYP domain-containing protein n=1 Tax=Agrobacterium tumefaciens TaxID=358 RepID=UPI001573C9DA|nr:HD-GYP domain-containing protein [Agrobacterium tumefaciens]NSZ66564.1 HD-GYP domain-containing protein [Agrobacterium tumefaciens]NTA72936.1 HD-GYP domain-containing protein [Agrobacterium tumefaciens]WIE41484.1 HD-GYP domain-containing protein [Agrobacterium tumefaciens]